MSYVLNMLDEKKEKGGSNVDDIGREVIDLPDDRTDAEKIQDEQLERLDRFFAELSPGTSILIERIKPSWCSGLLEEIYVEDEQIDLDYFIQQWGGKVLCVKVRDSNGRLHGRHRIPLNSFPPLVYGEPIKRATPADHFALTQRTGGETPSSSTIVNQMPPQKQNDVDTMLKMFEAQQKQRMQDLQFIMQMTKPNSNSSADFTKMVAAFAQMQQLFGNQQGGEVSEVDFIPQALEVMKMVFDKGQGQSQDAKIVEPKKQALPGPPGSVTPIRQDQKALSDILAQMDPESASNTIIEAIGKMSPDKRDAAFSVFLNDFRETVGDESGSEDTADQPNTKRGNR